jgi:hypothetical protein
MRGIMLRMSNDDLLSRLNDQPFKPFRMRLLNNSAVDVLHPGSVIVGETSAIVPTEWGVSDRGRRIALDWKTIAIDHITEFVDLKVKDNGRKGGKT